MAYILPECITSELRGNRNRNRIDEYNFFDIIHCFEITFQKGYYFTNLTPEKWKSFINFKLLVDIINLLKSYSLDKKLIKFDECEDKIKTKHKKNFKMLEYLSKQFKFSNMIYDLDELATIFDEYEIGDPVLKKALNPFIKEVQKIWEFKLNKEVEEFIILHQAQEFMQQLHNGEIILNYNDSDSDSD